MIVTGNGIVGAGKVRCPSNRDLVRASLNMALPVRRNAVVKQGTGSYHSNPRSV